MLPSDTFAYIAVEEIGGWADRGGQNPGRQHNTAAGRLLPRYHHPDNTPLVPAPQSTPLYVSRQ